MNKEIRLIGVISDTHNLLRPEVLEALKNADLIVHAGDICNLKVLEELEAIAPVVAVRGNNDKGSWADDLPVYRIIEAGGVFIYVIHDIKETNIYPIPPEATVVVSGHSHQPSIKNDGNVLYLNPGSAGRIRFSLPVSVATLKVSGKNVDARIIPILVNSK